MNFYIKSYFPIPYPFHPSLPTILDFLISKLIP